MNIQQRDEPQVPFGRGQHILAASSTHAHRFHQAVSSNDGDHSINLQDSPYLRGRSDLYGKVDEKRSSNSKRHKKKDPAGGASQQSKISRSPERSPKQKANLKKKLSKPAGQFGGPDQPYQHTVNSLDIRTPERDLGQNFESFAIPFPIQDSPKDPLSAQLPEQQEQQPRILPAGRKTPLQEVQERYKSHLPESKIHPTTKMLSSTKKNRIAQVAEGFHANMTLFEAQQLSDLQRAERSSTQILAHPSPKKKGPKNLQTETDEMTSNVLASHNSRQHMQAKRRSHIQDIISGSTKIAEQPLGFVSEQAAPLKSYNQAIRVRNATTLQQAISGIDEFYQSEHQSRTEQSRGAGSPGKKKAYPKVSGINLKQQRVISQDAFDEIGQVKVPSLKISHKSDSKMKLPHISSPTFKQEAIKFNSTIQYQDQPRFDMFAPSEILALGHSTHEPAHVDKQQKNLTIRAPRNPIKPYLQPIFESSNNQIQKIMQRHRIKGLNPQLRMMLNASTDRAGFKANDKGINGLRDSFILQHYADQEQMVLNPPGSKFNPYQQSVMNRTGVSSKLDSGSRQQKNPSQLSHKNSSVVTSSRQPHTDGRQTRVEPKYLKEVDDKKILIQEQYPSSDFFRTPVTEPRTDQKLPEDRYSRKGKKKKQNPGDMYSLVAFKNLAMEKPKWKSLNKQSSLIKIVSQGRQYHYNVPSQGHPSGVLSQLPSADLRANSQLSQNLREMMEKEKREYSMGQMPDIQQELPKLVLKKENINFTEGRPPELISEDNDPATRQNNDDMYERSEEEVKHSLIQSKKPSGSKRTKKRKGRRKHQDRVNLSLEEELLLQQYVDSESNSDRTQVVNQPMVQEHINLTNYQSSENQPHNHSSKQSMGGGHESHPHFGEHLPRNLAQSKTTRNHLNQKQFVRSIDNPDGLSPDLQREGLIQEQFKETKQVRSKLKNTFISRPSGGNKIRRLHPPPAQVQSDPRPQEKTATDASLDFRKLHEESRDISPSFANKRMRQTKQPSATNMDLVVRPVGSHDPRAKKPPILKHSHQNMPHRDKNSSNLWKSRKTSREGFQKHPSTSALSHDRRKSSHGRKSEKGSQMLPLAEKEELDSEDEDRSKRSLLRSPGEFEAPGQKPKLDDFTDQEVVGVGNFGKVFKARNKRKQNRLCALKIVSKESVAAMKQVDHIINEREVLHYLARQHQQQGCPFIMGIYDQFQDKENLFFELEYIEGSTLLRQIRERNPLISTHFKFYTAEVLRTLEFLHGHNIIYRDLKPENIMLSRQHRGHIKLVDFGFAKRLVGSEKTRTNCGTPAYISPEVLRGGGYSFQVDVWSLGQLIVEMISGQTPFQAEDTKQMYEKIMLCRPTYNRFVPQQLREFLNKIFVPDPEIRLTLKQIKSHWLFKEIDWTVSMKDLFEKEEAPFIPEETFESTATADKNAEKNLLAALFDMPPMEQQKLSFDAEHFKKFLKEEGSERTTTKRKRQNILGDFKFKKIDEYF